MSIDDRLRRGLGTVPVSAHRPGTEAILAAGEARRDRRLRREALTGVASVFVVVLLVVIVVATRDPGPTKLTTQPPGTSDTQPNADRGSVPPVPAIRDRSLYAPPAPQSDGVTLKPSGPYEDGQDVQVNVDTARLGRLADQSGSPFMLCASIQDVGEACDIRAEAAGWSPSWIQHEVLGPDGYIDCRSDGVVCRVVVRLESGKEAASAPIELRSPAGGRRPGANVQLSPGKGIADGSLIAVAVDGLAVDRMHDELVPLIPDGVLGFETAHYTTLLAQLCRFRRNDERAFAYTRTECAGVAVQGLQVGPGKKQADGQVKLTRLPSTYRGSHECAVSSCVLLLSRGLLTEVKIPTVNQRLGYVGAAPVEFDPTSPSAPRPTLRLAPTGPYAEGQQVEVIGADFPAGRNFAILQGCVPDEEPDSIGFVPQYRFCSSTAVPPSTGYPKVDANGSFTVTITVGCQAPDKRCVVTAQPSTEGAVPGFADAPYEIRG